MGVFVLVHGSQIGRHGAADLEVLHEENTIVTSVSKLDRRIRYFLDVRDDLHERYISDPSLSTPIKREG